MAGGPGSGIPMLLMQLKNCWVRFQCSELIWGIWLAACGGRIQSEKGLWCKQTHKMSSEKERLLIVWESHSFLVDKGSIGKNIRIEAENLIDGSIEALSYMDLPAFSVQYRLNACDNGEISDEVKRFLELCKRR